MYCTSKIVVFDLDETLGYFSEFGMFWYGLVDFIKIHNIGISIDQDLFDSTLDLFPEFLRPNIINILNYLKKKKMIKHCNKLMIYTNNQGPEEWAQQIQKYFETKMNYKLFDQIIKAFKINDKQVELSRTSHMKNHKDLISCTKIPETTEICFLDDVFHPGMVNDRIYYINIKPYLHDLPFDTMIDRLVNSQILIKIDKNILETMKVYILKYMKKFNHTYVEKTKESQDIDKILSKQILYHLHIFFNKTTNKYTARKYIQKKRSKTKKKK
jgi:hypothetical protein